MYSLMKSFMKMNLYHFWYTFSGNLLQLKFLHRESKIVNISTLICYSNQQIKMLWKYKIEHNIMTL